MDRLFKTMRWFGPDFGVKLSEIRELGVEGIVTACHGIPTGEIWPRETVQTLADTIATAGLKWTVVESVNIHPAIKYGLPNRDTYIENYMQTLKHLAACGIKIVCYNFMPLLDWTRTQLDFRLANGEGSLRFDPIAIAAFDLFVLGRNRAAGGYDENTQNSAKEYFANLTATGREQLQRAILAGLPGSKEAVPMADFKRDLNLVSAMTKADLRQNLVYFLQCIIPEAEALGIKMAIHPDDPPFPVFGIPRVAATAEDFGFILDSIPSPSNGVTFCTGSLGANPQNDLPKMIASFGEHIHFIHLRNIKREADGSFYESDHLDGQVPMTQVMSALIKEQLRRKQEGSQDVGIPYRPDHGHVLLSDNDKQETFYPGYSLIGRAKGLAQLEGLELGLRQHIL